MYRICLLIALLFSLADFASAGVLIDVDHDVSVRHSATVSVDSASEIPAAHIKTGDFGEFDDLVLGEETLTNVAVFLVEERLFTPAVSRIGRTPCQVKAITADLKILRPV
ncbi:hypothetical protein N9M41_07120 [Rhodopirellula sp.]|nr:hypothetical protein [Rhodopirellula sp.]